jgi:N-acetylneuraminate synthase
MKRVFIVAEAGMSHDGSLGNAIRMAEIAAQCGADAVKFQLHDAAAESIRDAPSPPYFQHESRWDYFTRTAFSDGQWRELKAACDAAGVEFLCSPFSAAALERLEALGTARYKIGSGEVTNLQLVRLAAETRKPLLLSSGMSSWAELDDAVAAAGDNLTVLQCTSEYPTPPERVGLNLLAVLRERYGKPVGLSDHSLGPHACFAATALGATAIEKHFTLSREMYGPDASIALEPGELTELVAGVRAIEAMISSPVDKDARSEALREMKGVFEKSIVSTRDIPAGAVIAPDMVDVKKPGTGIPARRMEEVLGRSARVSIPADSLVDEEDLH